MPHAQGKAVIVYILMSNRVTVILISYLIIGDYQIADLNSRKHHN